MLAQFLELGFIEWRPSAGQESRWPLQCRLAKRVADFPWVFAVSSTRAFCRTTSRSISRCFGSRNVRRESSALNGIHSQTRAGGTVLSTCHHTPLIGPAPLLGMFCTKPFEMCLHAWIVLRHEARQNVDFICHAAPP
jgi:hypothetical protein